MEQLTAASSTVRSFLLLSRKLASRLQLAVVLAAGLVAGCAGLQVEDFYRTKQSENLREGELVLFYGKWVGAPDGYVVVTDERVFYWDTYSLGRCGDEGPRVSVDHVEVRQIQIPALYLVLELYDGRTVSVCGVWIHRKIANVIQQQLDHVNEIRAELGIVVPDEVSDQQLRDLNAPVLAEIRKRRKTGLQE